MKVIYMNDTLCLMQSTQDLEELNTLVISGELKTLNEKPYLLIIEE